MADSDKRGKSTRVMPRGSSSQPDVAEPPPLPAAETPTDLQRWAAAAGAAPRVSVGEPDASEALRPQPGAGRYASVAVLGRGGVGEVDLVLDRDLGRKVAKKRLRQEFRSEPILVQAFIEEAMIAGALEHPGIVPVHDIGVSAGEGPWYTMKRLQGEALATILSRLRSAHPETLKRWPLPRLVEVFVQVLRAVTHAHQRGVVHCDLKPGNVIVGDLGEVVVVDWGLAKVLGEGGKQQARAQLWSGSPGYMGREQATLTDALHIDKPTDIWALGAILYELMTLVVPQARPDGTIPEPPADGSWYAPLVPLRQRALRGPYRREIPPPLEAVCERALADLPADRYQDVREMLADVEAWLQGTRERERREAKILAIAQAADHILQRGIDDVPALVALVDELVATMAAMPDRPELAWRGSALYWQVFRALHLKDERLPREVATALLDRLADNVVPAPEDDAIGPWLQALDEVADEAPQVRSLANRLRALHAAPLFSGLGGHALLPVASAVEVRKVKAGTPLFREGEPGDALWVLVSGAVRVEAGGRVLNSMAPPACFGEVALVDRSTRTASVIADSDVLALTLTAERFDALVRRHGVIAMGVMRLLAERLRNATAREIAARRST